MLVLARKLHERIIVNENIVLTVVRISHDSVRIGIDCPKEIPVHRQEVYESIKRKAENAD